MNNAGSGEDLRERAAQALTMFDLVGPQRDEVWREFQTHPDGVERCARQALSGDNPTALLLHLVRNGAHRKVPTTEGASNVECPFRVEAGRPGGTIIDGEPMGEEVIARDFDDGENAKAFYDRTRGEGGWDWVEMLWWNPKLPGRRKWAEKGSKAPTSGDWQVLDSHRRIVIRPDEEPSQFVTPQLRTIDM